MRHLVRFDKQFFAYLFILIAAVIGMSRISASSVDALHRSLVAGCSRGNDFRREVNRLILSNSSGSALLASTTSARESWSALIRLTDSLSKKTPKGTPRDPVFDDAVRVWKRNTEIYTAAIVKEKTAQTPHQIALIDCVSLYGK